MRTRAPFLMIASLALSSCAGPVETRINAAGAGIATAQPLMLAPLAPGEEAARPGLVAGRQALGTALAAQGYRLAEDAPLAVTIGVAERPARISVSAGQGDTALSPAKKQHLLQNCDDRLMRVTVGIVDRASGDVRYAGSAEEAHCHAALTDAMPRLVGKAVEDMHQPAGARREFSLARD